MKFMRICLLVCGLMLAFVGVTYASSFSVSADKYGKVEGNGIEFSFSENNKIIQIAFLTKAASDRVNPRSQNTKCKICKSKASI